MGQVPNYNLALSRIHPEARFVKMVQADDWLFPSCLAEMCGLASQHPEVGVVGSYDLRGGQPKGGPLSPERRVLPGREACRMYFLDDVRLFASPTATLYRADLVRSRPQFYDEGRYFEDVEVVFELLEVSDFGFVHQILSCDCVRPGSTFGAMKSRDAADLIPYVLVKRYGPRFLGEEGYLPRAAEARRAYYRRLASAWLSRRGADYWEYHRKGLAQVGETLSRTELLKQVGVELLSLAAPRALHGGWLRSRSRGSEPGHDASPR